METTIGICFYCKHVINGNKKTCSHCGRATRVINVKVEATLLTPKWKFWDKKYHYKVLDPKYAWIEDRLNTVSTGA